MAEIFKSDEEYIFKAEFIEDYGLRFMPTGESIVRCKDCKWYRENEAYCVYWASIYVNADATPRYTPFDYCFRGVRKENEK